MKSSVNLQALQAADTEGLVKALENYLKKGRFKRMFDDQIFSARTLLESIIKLPKSVEGCLEAARGLQKLKILQRQSDETLPALCKLLKDENFEGPPQPPHFWHRIAQLVYPLLEFSVACYRHPDRRRLIDLLHSPAEVYQNSAQIRALALQATAFKRERALLLNTLPDDSILKQAISGSRSLREQERRLTKL